MDIVVVLGSLAVVLLEDMVVHLSRVHPDALADQL